MGAPVPWGAKEPVMTLVPTIALAVMAAADVVTLLFLLALGLAALRVIRHVQAVVRGLQPDVQPIVSDVRSLLQRMRTTADVARNGAEHARASLSGFGDAAGHIRALVAPPAFSRWGLLAGSKTGARAVRKWYAKRRAA